MPNGRRVGFCGKLFISENMGTNRKSMCAAALSARMRRDRRPLQNRVNPFGDIVAISQRGLYIGNRGIIHDPATKTRNSSPSAGSQAKSSNSVPLVRGLTAGGRWIRNFSSALPLVVSGSPRYAIRAEHRGTSGVRFDELHGRKLWIRLPLSTAICCLQSAAPVIRCISK
jgi:hypothetical protein